MKLNYLQLCNFRQFYGKTPRLEFASGERNTTVIYGNNGAGKTSILNAFTWVLYQKFTAAFAAPELLINQRAIAEAQLERAVECWVELQFERDRKIYQLKRKCYATKDKQSQVSYIQANLFMLVAGDDGRWYPPLEAPEDIINRILPASLHQYFFFDGERIDGFFRHHNSHIAEDTKELLGVKVLDRGIEHLKQAKRTFQSELSELGDAQTKRLMKQQLDLEQKIETIDRRLIEISQEVADLKQSKSNLSRQLLEISGVEEIQKLKLTLLEQQKLSRQKLLDCKQKLKKRLSQDSYLVFLPTLSDSYRNLLQTLRERGQLASGFKQEFVRQLLEQQECLCGTKLIPETQTYERVKAWLNKAELKNIEESAIRLEAEANSIPAQLDTFWQQLDRQQAEIKQQYQEQNRLESELERVNKQLKAYPNRDSQQLQQRIEAQESSIEHLVLERGENQQQQKNYNQQLAQLIQQIARQQLTEHKQQLAQRRIAVIEEAIARLGEVRIRLEHKFRQALEAKVREIFSFISFTPYIPKLSQDYKLTLVKTTLGKESPVAASTGENQILSLSFIGGIIDRVKHWSQNNTLLSYDSSTFPIVMDSPFGSLDQIYRRQVAKGIPQLANQLIILVTKTQWQGEVERETRASVGAEYVLAYYSSKSDCDVDRLQLGLRQYPLVSSSSHNFEYTEIIAVEHKG